VILDRKSKAYSRIPYVILYALVVCVRVIALADPCTWK
jgi:hypothetical protein